METDKLLQPDPAFAREGIAFGEQLEQESDRGAALVGLAFLDELLSRLFEAKMRTGKITKRVLAYPGPFPARQHERTLPIASGGLEKKPTATL